MGSRVCRIEDCNRKIAQPKFYCHLHWQKIPGGLQREIVDAYVDAYLDVIADDDPPGPLVTALKEKLERADRAIARGASRRK